MKQSMLWKVSVSTSPDADDAVAERLGTIFGQPASSYTDAETQQATVSVYLRERPAEFTAGKKELALGLKVMARNGLDIGPGGISLTRIPQKDWAESWKLHFKPMVIGSALLLKPSWSRRHARKGQAVIVLDPGLSFGTGRHPTTAFCLREVVGRRPRASARSFLDVGTGSGILAIAAAKLGYGPVDALDCDPESIRVARANARRNGVSAGIRFRRQDLAGLPRRSATKYSVICANLVSSLLLAELERMLARLHADGALVVAGILKLEFGQVQAAFESAGLRLVSSRTQHEWRSGAFVWR
jgi:ribosomal protein L11 methyltransferase